jgi:DNA-binding CsgD family transcriptional regulator
LVMSGPPADLVADSLADEPVEVWAVAGALAVLGRPDPDLLAALTGLPTALLTNGLRTLREHELLSSAGHVEAAVRAAILATMDSEDIQQLRVLAASALSDAGRPVEEAADQLVLTPDDQQPWMTGLLRDAAARARRSGDSRAEVTYLTRALAVEPGAVRLRAERAVALVRVDPRAAVTALTEVFGSIVDVRERATIAVRLAQAAVVTGAGALAVDVLVEALAGLTAATGDGHGPEDRQLQALLEATLLAAGLSDPATAAWTRNWARALPVPAGDGAGERQLLAVGALHAALNGGTGEAVVRRARQAIRVPELNLVGWSELSAAFALHLADETPVATAQLDRVLAAGHGGGGQPILLLASGLLAYLRWDCGELGTAVALAQSALAEADRSVPSWCTLTLRISLINALAARGELDRAGELLEILSADPVADCVLSRPARLMARAAVLQRSDPEAALHALTACGTALAACRIDNPVFAPWWLETALLLARLGRSDEAADAVAHGNLQSRRWGTPRARGLALLARGATTRGEAGIRLLTEAVSLLATTPARLDHARAERLLGDALLRSGDVREASRHLGRALGQAVRSDCPPLIAETRALLPLAGMTPVVTALTGPRRLTASEEVVASLAAGGQTNRAIAAALFVSVRTVELHLTRIYRKLGITSRLELAMSLDHELAECPC